jgi:hypothetical protein
MEEWMDKTFRLIFVAILVGITLAFVQFGLIYTLNIRFASTVFVYLILFGAWLMGMMFGLVIPEIKYIRWAQVASMSFIVFCIVLLTKAPSNIVNFFSIVTATFSAAWGMRFIRVYGPIYRSARMILLWENNGFIIGILLTVLTVIFFGLLVSIVAGILMLVVPWLPILLFGKPTEDLEKLLFHHKIK